MMRRAWVLSMLAALCASAGAHPRMDSAMPARGMSTRNLPKATGEEHSYRIEVKAEYSGLKHRADFVTANASQANYVMGGDKAVKIKTGAGEGLEFKKWGFIVNVLPVADPNVAGHVSLQLQMEISGPVDAEGRDIRTWQLQSELLLKEGEWTKVARGDGVAEVRLTRVK